MRVDTPPASRCLMSVRFDSGLGDRSPWRAKGGTAMTDRDRSAAVTALVFNTIPPGVDDCRFFGIIASRSWHGRCVMRVATGRSLRTDAVIALRAAPMGA